MQGRLIFRVGIMCFILLFTTKVFAQNKISGTVKTTAGETLPGVSVVIKGTTKGTVTDIDGNYQISVPDEDATLVFSYVGYDKAEVKVDGKSEINVTLKEEVSELDEVVVIGYGVQQKSDLTGAITKVDTKELKESAVLGLDQALQGRAAGVQITQNSGMPGAQSTVTIRGMGTWNDSDPLYVVDGVPIEGDLSMVNPSDIKSIEVLKDASAAAIYGARAANGVILVTTKSGEAGESHVNVDFYTGIQEAWNFVDLTNAMEYREIYNYLKETTGKDPNDPRDADSFIPEDMGLLTTDWQKQVFRVANTTDMNVSVNGGSKKATYSITGRYYQQEGIITGTDYQKISFRANSDINVGERLKVGERFSLAMSDANEAPRGGRSPRQLALEADPISSVYRSQSDPFYDPDTAYWDDIEWSKSVNPVGYLERMDFERRKYPLFANAYAEYEFIEGLKFRMNGGINLMFHEFNSFAPTYYESGFSQNNLRSLTNRTWKNYSWTWENVLSYNKTFLDKHDVSAVAGFSRQYRTVEDLQASKVDFFANDEVFRYMTMGRDVVQPSDIIGRKTEVAVSSIFGRINYSYSNRYLVTASVRRDGSSRFGPQSEPKFGNTARFDYFPSFSLGWKISEEDFFKENVEFVNFAKVRVGWGQLGNDRTVRGNNYPYFTFVESGTPRQNYVFNNTIVDGATVVGKSVPDVRWERSSQTNFGIDVNFFDNRITFTGDYYIKKTLDQLVAVPLPDVVGLFDNPVDPSLGGNPLVNAGEVHNKGFEFVLTYRKKEGALNFDISANITRNRNEVINLGNSELNQILGPNGISYTTPGHPIASFRGYKTDGLYQESEFEKDVNGNWVLLFPRVDSEGNLMQPNAQPGDVKFKDINGDNKLTEEDKVIIGDPHPDFTYGLNIRANYKGFDMVMFWQGVYGNDIYSTLVYDFLGGNSSSNFHKDILDAYGYKGNTNTDVPRLDGNQTNQNFRTSDLYIQDGSYLRLKNLQIGYTIPAEYTDFAKIQRLRVYVAAQNLFTFTKYKYGYDPEIGRGYNRYGSGQEKDNVQTLNMGIDQGTYPQARVFMVGFNLIF